MRLRLGLALLVLAISAPATAQERALDAAVVLVVDVSSSMNEQERTYVRRAHALAVMSGAFLEAISEGRHKQVAVAYVEFGSIAKVKVAWTVIDGPERAAAFASAIQGLDHPGVGTNTAIGRGLEAAHGLLAALPWKAEKLVVDVVGDGITNDGPLPEDVTPRLVADGAMVNALPVMISPDTSNLEHYYRTEVAAGIGHFVMPVSTLSDLPVALRRKLVLELF